MEFNPKALIVTIVASAVLWYGITDEMTLSAVVVDVMLTFGIGMIPDGWMSRRSSSL